MTPGEAALVAGSIWFAVYLGYVLLTGMGTFWAIVWPEGHDLRRLRVVATVGLALVGLGVVAETAVDWLTQGHAFAPLPAFGETVVEQSAMWLLLRLAALAAVGFFGIELLRRPVRGARRVVVLALVGLLTGTLVVESAAAPSARVVGLLVTTGLYLLALAVWLGGLVAVAVLLAARDRPAGLERVWTRFSVLSGLSVLALVGTGAGQHLLAGGTPTARSGVLLLVEGLALTATLVLSRYAVRHGRRMAFRERYLRGFAVEPLTRRPRLGGAFGLQLVLSGALIAVAVAQLAVLPVPGRPGPPPLGDPAPTIPVATAREAQRADRDPARFVPERIDLPGGASAVVVPVATVGRELVVPEDPGRVGWWDGSSYVGDEYGSTVIAGHVDSLDRGLGFFFRLWNARVGDRVLVSAEDGRQAYAITALRQVPRTDLVDDEEVFAIDGPPRLVLITCAGEYRPERGGYSRNLVVIARPVP